MVEAANNQVNNVFNIMRRMPPNQVAKSLAGIGRLIQDDDLRQEIIEKVDQPLEIEEDTKTGKPFLKHEYNRDGDSYRSPWCNQYFPASEDCTFMPSAELLQLEQRANDLFAQYVYLYYDSGATSSVYFVDTDGKGFNAAFLCKKELKNEKLIKYGAWDAINVVSCTRDGEEASYKVITTVMIVVDSTTAKQGNFSINGSISKTKHIKVKLDLKEDLEQQHLKYIG